MKVRTSTGFMVVSHAGKPLSKPNLTSAQADSRLAQVERIKAALAKRKA